MRVPTFWCCEARFNAKCVDKPALLTLFQARGHSRQRRGRRQWAASWKLPTEWDISYTDQRGDVSCFHTSLFPCKSVQAQLTEAPVLFSSLGLSPFLTSKLIERLRQEGRKEQSS